MQLLGNEHLKLYLKWLVTVVIYNLRKLPCDWQIYKACMPYLCLSSSRLLGCLHTGTAFVPFISHILIRVFGPCVWQVRAVLGRCVINKGRGCHRASCRTGQRLMDSQWEKLSVQSDITTWSERHQTSHFCILLLPQNCLIYRFIWCSLEPVHHHRQRLWCHLVETSIYLFF